MVRLELGGTNVIVANHNHVIIEAQLNLSEVYMMNIIYFLFLTNQELTTTLKQNSIWNSWPYILRLFIFPLWNKFSDALSMKGENMEDNIVFGLPFYCLLRVNFGCTDDILEPEHLTNVVIVNLTLILSVDSSLAFELDALLHDEGSVNPIFDFIYLIS